MKKLLGKFLLISILAFFTCIHLPMAAAAADMEQMDADCLYCHTIQPIDICLGTRDADLFTSGLDNNKKAPGSPSLPIRQISHEYSPESNKATMQFSTLPPPDYQSIFRFQSTILRI